VRLRIYPQTTVRLMTREDGPARAASDGCALAG
jgi:hypothetical protein